VTNTSADQQPDERDPEVELVLTDNDYTRSMWYDRKDRSVHLAMQNSMQRNTCGTHAPAFSDSRVILCVMQSQLWLSGAL